MAEAQGEAQAEAAGNGPVPVLVVIPTYDERENLGPVVARVHAALPDAHVLVVDDGSPDGTGELADEMAAQDPRVSVLHRTEKAGLGAAYLAGFEVALRRGARVVVQMDADGSHPPEVLPAMVAALDHADIVLGSRYVPGGEVVNWPAHREWLSRGGSLYSRLALGLPIRDMTAGYRAFRREVLAELDLGAVSSTGYCFQIDMTWRAVQAGFRVVEVPITFTERERGSSKMSGAIVAEALWRVTQWGAARLLGRGRAAPTRGSGTTDPDAEPDGVAGVPDTVPDDLAPRGSAPRPHASTDGADAGRAAPAVDPGAEGALDGGAAEGTVRA